jgi:putative PIN family toxin of toxin-antitoxin system
MNAVIDTNVLISGIFWSGTPAEILRRWAEGKFRMVVTPEILDEYERVIELMEQKYPRVTAARLLLNAISVNGELITAPKLGLSICKDPDDDKFIAAAIASNSEFIVTGDKLLLAVNGYQGVRIVPPAKFLKLI